MVQRELLNIELNDLQQALMRAWRLPDLLVQINDERHAEASQVRNVLLAVRLARHSARGWDNAALGDDVRDIAALLTLGETPTLQLLRDIGPERATTVTLLVPVFAHLFGTTLLDEPLSVASVSGCALVLLSIALIFGKLRWPQRRDAKARGMRLPQTP